MGLTPGDTVVEEAYFGYVYVALGEKEPGDAPRGGDGGALRDAVA